MSFETGYLGWTPCQRKLGDEIMLLPLIVLGRRFEASGGLRNGVVGLGHCSSRKG